MHSTGLPMGTKRCLGELAGAGGSMRMLWRCSLSRVPCPCGLAPRAISVFLPCPAGQVPAQVGSPELSAFGAAEVRLVNI